MAEKKVFQKKIARMAGIVADVAERDGMPISRMFVFGSYAKGRANKKSDLDLCFVSSNFKDTISAEAYLRAKIYFSGIKLGIPIDVVAYKKREFEKENTPLLEEIKKHGVEIAIK